jgi:hypothetical protein
LVQRVRLILFSGPSGQCFQMDPASDPSFAELFTLV